MSSFDCVQQVPAVPTHVDVGTIDLVFTKAGETIGKVLVDPPGAVSDHSLICWPLPVQIQPHIVMEREFRKWKTIDHDEFWTALLKSELCEFLIVRILPYMYNRHVQCIPSRGMPSAVSEAHHRDAAVKEIRSDLDACEPSEAKNYRPVSNLTNPISCGFWIIWQVVQFCISVLGFRFSLNIILYICVTFRQLKLKLDCDNQIV